MFSPQLRGFLYGVLITTSLVSVATYASTHSDGVFGEYFERITGLCAANSVITGFEDASGTLGTKNCTTISSLVASLGIFNDAGNIGIGTNAPSAKLDVDGKIESHTTVITDTDNTVVTKGYLDDGLKGVCTSMGGTWSDIFKICTPTYTYTWQIGGYGACSVSCGPGTQTATINCMRNDGNIEADNKCAGTKPSASQSCNLGACPPPPPPAPVTPAPSAPSAPVATKMCLYSDSFFSGNCSTIADCAPTHTSWDTNKCGAWSDNPQCDGYKDSPVVSCR